MEKPLKGPLGMSQGGLNMKGDQFKSLNILIGQKSYNGGPQRNPDPKMMNSISNLFAHPLNSL